MKSVPSEAPISIERSELPTHGRPVFYFPNPNLGGGEADIVYRITPATGESWYAALAEQNPLAPRRAFVMPDGTSVFVDGYVICARNQTLLEIKTMVSARLAPSHSTLKAVGLVGIGMVMGGPNGRACHIRCPSDRIPLPEAARIP